MIQPPTHSRTDILRDWHPWFAWHPVRTFDERWVWLCYVERRRLYSRGMLDWPGYYYWEYNTLLVYPPKGR